MRNDATDSVLHRLPLHRSFGHFLAGLSIAHEAGGEHYRGIVAIATDLRLERRRKQSVVGGGMNLFVGGAIESCGTIVHTVDEVVASLRDL